MTDYPTVYIGVPTGYIKEYAVLQMLASLRNIDYPLDKLQLTFAVTNLKNPKSVQFKHHLKKLLSGANMPFPTKILHTYPKREDMYRWGPYYGVIINLHRLRLDFLEHEQWERFWLLGGDNPPGRCTLKELVDTEGDVVSAQIYQRPKKVENTQGVSVVYDTEFLLSDIREDLEPRLRDELRTAYLEFGFLRQLGSTKKKQVDQVIFGSGCSLIKREVLQYLGYALGFGGNHSEDLHFGLWANILGFKTVANLESRCFHFDEDGSIY